MPAYRLKFIYKNVAVGKNNTKNGGKKLQTQKVKIADMHHHNSAWINRT